MKLKGSKLKVGGPVKVKDKVYLVLHITDERILCRQFYFTKSGRFRFYQDYNFPVFICTPGKKEDEELINQQKIQAIMQRKPYSAIRDTCFQNLIR